MFQGGEVVPEGQARGDLGGVATSTPWGCPRRRPCGPRGPTGPSDGPSPRQGGKKLAQLRRAQRLHDHPALAAPACALGDKHALPPEVLKNRRHGAQAPIGLWTVTEHLLDEGGVRDRHHRLSAQPERIALQRHLTHGLPYMLWCDVVIAHFSRPPWGPIRVVGVPTTHLPAPGTPVRSLGAGMVLATARLRSPWRSPEVRQPRVLTSRGLCITPGSP